MPLLKSEISMHSSSTKSVPALFSVCLSLNHITSIDPPKGDQDFPVGLRWQLAEPKCEGAHLMGFSVTCACMATHAQVDTGDASLPMLCAFRRDGVELPLSMHKGSTNSL